MPGAGSHLPQHSHDGLVVFGWGSGADTTAPSMPHCRRSLYRTAQHAGTHSPFPPRKCLFGPWLGRRQPCLLDPQSLPKHRLSRDIPVAHCEHQPRPHSCPERHQWPRGGGCRRGPAALHPKRAPGSRKLRPSSRSVPRHTATRRHLAMAHGITPPRRMASPCHGTQPHGPGTGSHEWVPGAGMGKGCLGAPKWRPCVPHSHGDTCAWLGTAETAGHHGHSAPPPDARSAPSPGTRVRTEHRPLIPPKAPRLGADTSHTPLGTHRSRMGTAAGRAARPSPGRREPGEERTSPG